jgi:hypothetical protein
LIDIRGIGGERLGDSGSAPSTFLGMLGTASRTC